MLCSSDEQQYNNQIEIHSFTSYMLLVYWQYSSVPLAFYMVQQSRDFGSSATDSVNHLVSLSSVFSPYIQNENDIFLAFVKVLVALKGDL